MVVSGSSGNSGIMKRAKELHFAIVVLDNKSCPAIN